MTIRGIAYGGDYNPEQWPREVWAEDVALMQRAGVNLVTVGVFAWSRIQSGPGQFDLGWIDEVLDLLYDGGIRVDLATATASPPSWLVAAHPEMLPVRADGVRLGPGSRQHFCPSSPAYRAAALELVAVLADRYRDHPALELWHIGNEYGCHVPACHCEVSQTAFRAWLRARYGDDLAALNSAWGTDFWSQRITAWDEIRTPAAAPTFLNPTLQLDFARFSSGELLGCYRAERDVLAARSPGMPATTNLMTFFRPVDSWSFAPYMDVQSVDCYPDPADPAAHLTMAAAGDITRSLGGGQPWILMEQAPAAVNWRFVNVPKAPGQLRELSLTAVARGSDGILQFQWRASVAGAEKFHSGMVPHAGTDTRVFREVEALGRDLAALAPVAGTRVTADVAILLDWESWWALELEAHPSGYVWWVITFQHLYAALFDAHVTVDVAHPAADLSGYRLVIAPHIYLVSDAAAENLTTFVRSGGTALVTYFSGIVDPDDHVRPGSYPAPWKDLLGLHVEEHWPLAEGATDLLGGTLAGPSASASLWREQVHLHGAEPLLTFGSAPLAGSPAATRHAYGDGLAVYLATWPDRETLASLLAWTCERARVRPVLDAPAGVEAVRRGDVLFLINHTAEPTAVDLPEPGRDLLSGRSLSGRITLAPRDAVALVGVADVPADLVGTVHGDGPVAGAAGDLRRRIEDLPDGRRRTSYRRGLDRRP
ncbi:MAG TPA: beta-galactosidase [Mycobacteriales bacterium]